MKAIVNKTDLTFAVNAAEKALGKSSISEDYANISMSAEGNTLTLYASNGEVTITAKANAEITEDGSAATNGAILSAALKKITAEEITVETEKARIVLSYNDGMIALPLLQVDEGLISRGGKYETAITMNATKFVGLVGCLKTFVAADETRKTLRGINFSTEGDKLTAVASDAMRVTRIVQTAETGGADFNITVPATALNIVCQLMDKSTDTISLMLSEKRNTLRVANEVITITAVLYNENYPIKLEKILPKETESIVKVNKDALAQSVSRADVVADRNNTVILDFSNPNELTVTANSESGKMTDILKACIDGEWGKIAVSCKYISDMLKYHDGDTVELNVAGSRLPLVVYNGNATFVIVPIRTD